MSASSAGSAVAESAVERAATQYHLSELRIAQDASAPGHLLPPIPDDCRSVLDIGCGAGQTLIASSLDAQVAAFGIDPDATALSLGRSLTDRVQFSAAAAEALPFASDSFDFVFSRVALPYSNIPRALLEIARVLRSEKSIWLSLHPPRFAVRTVGRAIRAGNVRAAIFPLYVLLNGFALHVLNRQLVWPFGRRRYESTQTAAGMRRALRLAGFKDVQVTRGRFFIITARKA
jgi:SAM-dependent methyltransferase